MNHLLAESLSRLQDYQSLYDDPYNFLGGQEPRDFFEVIEDHVPADACLVCEWLKKDNLTILERNYKRPSKPYAWL